MLQLDHLVKESATKSDQLRVRLQNRDEAMVQAIETMSTRLESLNGMSVAPRSDVQELIAILKDVQLDVQGMHQQQSSILQRANQDLRRTDDSSSSASPSANHRNSDGIYGSLFRLCNLAALTQCELHSDEAQVVIQDLQQLIVMLLQSVDPIADITNESMEGDDEEALREMRKLHGTQLDGALHQIENMLLVSRKVRLATEGKTTECCSRAVESGLLLIPALG